MSLAPDWLNTPFLRHISHALGQDSIRFVGGCVRDSLLGRPFSDLDACTPLLPTACIDRLAKAGVKTIPTGIKHGTITVLDPDSRQTLELTTLRRDAKTDGRHADVIFTDSWLEDAQRRDFTINALYLGIDGQLYDPVGGLSDLKAGVVRFIGNAEDRIREDVLRILRFFRFHMRYAKGKPDTAALSAAQNLVPLMKKLSRERIRDELFKILAHDRPQQTVGLMNESGIFPYILPMEMWNNPIEEIEYIDDGLLRFLRLINNDKATVLKAAKILRLSNRDRDHMLSILKVLQMDILSDQQTMLTAVYNYGTKAVEDALLYKNKKDLLRTLPEVPIFPLKGQDLIDLGWQAGPDLGRMITMLENQWLASSCRLTKDELINRAMALLEAPSGG